jgi:hypothetical protein
VFHFFSPTLLFCRGHPGGASPGGGLLRRWIRRIGPRDGGSSQGPVNRAREMGGRSKSRGTTISVSAAGRRKGKSDDSCRSRSEGARVSLRSTAKGTGTRAGGPGSGGDAAGGRRRAGGPRSGPCEAQRQGEGSREADDEAPSASAPATEAIPRRWQARVHLFPPNPSRARPQAGALLHPLRFFSPARAVSRWSSGRPQWEGLMAGRSTGGSRTCQGGRSKRWWEGGTAPTVE